MSSTIYAALKLEISQYQEALNRARVETEKWKQKVQQSTSGMGQSMFGSLLKADFAAQGLRAGVGALDSFVRRGIEFNATMDNSAVGIANVLRQFDGLSREAAKDEAAKAMRRIIELEPQTAGSLADLAQGFMQTLATAKSVGLTTEQNVVLTSKFANALANAGLSIHQLGQEYRSILSGNITADSALAKTLGITNEGVAQIKARGGDMFEFLSGMLREFGEAGDSAGVSWSSFQSALDKAAGDFAAGLFSDGINSAKELSVWLETNRGLFVDLGGAVATVARGAAAALQVVVTGAKEAGVALGAVFSEITVFDEDGTQRAASVLERFKILRDKFREQEAADAAESAGGAPGANPFAPVRPGAGGAVNDPFAGSAPAKTKKTDAFKEILDLQKREAENDELRRRLELDAMTRREKIAQFQKEIAALTGAEVEARGRDDLDAALNAEQKRLELQRELNALVKDEMQDRDAMQRKRDEEGDRFAETFKQQEAAKKSLAEELAIAAAKARGDEGAVERMEREVKIREKAAEIQAQTNISAEAARASAEKLVMLEEMAAKRRENEMAKAGDGERRKGHIGGVTARRYMGGHLSDFEELQRQPFGAGALARHRDATGGGPLSGVQQGNAAAAEKTERDARGMRDPNTAVLNQMLELWKKELS